MPSRSCRNLVRTRALLITRRLFSSPNRSRDRLRFHENSVMDDYLECFKQIIPGIVTLFLGSLLIYAVFLRGRFPDFLWGNKVIMSVSTLDSSEQVTFSFEDKNNSYREDVIIWQVDGFTKYIEEFSDEFTELGWFEQHASGKALNRSGEGFWIFSFDTPTKSAKTGGDFVGLDNPSIRAFRIAEHIIINGKFSLEELEMAVSIRAYMEGDVELKVRYEDSLSRNVRQEYFSEEFKGKGFCNMILHLPFQHRINTLHIQPRTTSFRKRGIVVIDQVIVVVTRLKMSESFIYTLVPGNWC